MRFILDTNILIPLQDSQIALEPSLTEFIRLAGTHDHKLLYHESSERDIRRDSNPDRREKMLLRLGQYEKLRGTPECPWNTSTTSDNDRVDNEILYSLEQCAAHGLLTEDRGIHAKARAHGLAEKVYTIQTALDFLRRLHLRNEVRLPNIESTEMYKLIGHLKAEFFESLREGYGSNGFDTWFRDKAKEGREAWVNWQENKKLGGICVYAKQTNERVTSGRILVGPSLKLCTFKVSEESRGKKIGELFLKAAFRYAAEHELEHIFIHGDEVRHQFLFEMLEDFGFQKIGYHPKGDQRDAVYLKEHPSDPPADQELNNFEYSRRYYPHFRDDESVSKYIVPINPQYHDILFPDYEGRAQMVLFIPTAPDNTAGNAIKQAYLSHSPTSSMEPGDIVFFYRSGDDKSLTSVGIVESYLTMEDPDEIAAHVKRRTVYTMDEIRLMAEKPTRVMLFRLVRHLDHPKSLNWLIERKILKGPPQSIGRLKIDQRTFNGIISDEA